MNADNYLSTDTGILGYNMYSYCNNSPINYDDHDGHGIGLFAFVAVFIAGTVFVANSISKIKKAKREINEVQKKKNVPDKTQKFNETMKQNAATLQKQVRGQSPVQTLATFRKEVNNGSTYDLKLTEEWNTPIKYNDIIMEPQDIGNFHYGYIGRAIITNCFTIGFCDDLRDTIFIRAGAIKYDTEN